MPLNPVDKMVSLKTFRYDEDGAKDWEAFIKYCPRKLNVYGKVDPKGGLIDILMKKGNMTNASIILYQFRPLEENDTTEYKKLRPQAYDGTKLVPVGEYVQSQKCAWCKTNPALADRVAGHWADRESETIHHGKFPPNAYECNSIQFDSY